MYIYSCLREETQANRKLTKVLTLWSRASNNLSTQFFVIIFILESWIFKPINIFFTFSLHLKFLKTVHEQEDGSCFSSTEQGSLCEADAHLSVRHAPPGWLLRHQICRALDLSGVQETWCVHSEIMRYHLPAGLSAVVLSWIQQMHAACSLQAS